LTTNNKPTQDNKQYEQTEPKILHRTTPVPADRNPFIFSRGYWLSHDRARQAARQIYFNIPELCKRVVACCPGAHSIASWSKQVGHISRTLTFHTDNGKRRISMRILGVFPMADHFANGVIPLGLENVANKKDCLIPNRSWQGTLEEHVDLLNHARRVLKILAMDPRVISISTPTMMPCLTLNHIFVKPGEPETITCMTGWRECTISPAFLFSVNPILSIPNPYLTSGKTEAEVDLLLLFDDDVARANVSFHRRLIHRLRSIPPELTGFRPRPAQGSPPDYGQLHKLFWLCHRTWADGIPLVQEGLLRIAESWRSLDLPHTCPYEPLTGKDLQIHELRWELFADWANERGEVNFKVGVDEIDHELVLIDYWDVLEKLKHVSMSRCLEAMEMCDIA
ncbi:hypothetical protein KCU98_g1733, partial [Aureobasidium melanogenum]